MYLLYSSAIEYLLPINLEAAGGSVSIAANDVKTNRLGSHVRNFFRDASTKADILPRSTNKIFLAGLVIQLVSFFLFTCMYLRFLQRIYFYHPEIWQRDSRAHWFNDWRILALALFISCIGILVGTSAALSCTLI